MEGKNREIIVVIDVGNSNTTFGIFVDGGLVCEFRILTNRDYTGDQYYHFFRTALVRYFSYEEIDSVEQDITCVVVSNVVPQTRKQMRIFLSRHLRKPFIFVDHQNHDLRILLQNPREIGSDIVCNAIGALSKYDQDCIVVDFGTATTFVAIRQKDRALLGTIIAPGIQSSLHGLVQHAAQLIEVEIIKPEGGVLQTNTIRSMQAGLFYGFLSMAEGIVQRLRQELEITPKIILTGGFSELIGGEDMNFFDIVEKKLILEGLYQIYLINQSS
jgi:type III pantothenate kinase